MLILWPVMAFWAMILTVWCFVVGVVNAPDWVCWLIAAVFFWWAAKRINKYLDKVEGEVK